MLACHPKLENCLQSESEGWWRRRETCPAAGRCSVAWRELDVSDLLASTSPRHDRRVMREGGQAREAPEYAPRRPETTILYRVIQRWLETWLDNARTRERTVPIGQPSTSAASS